MMHAMPDQIYLTEFKRSAEDRYKANRNNTDQLSNLTLPKYYVSGKQGPTTAILFKTKSIPSNTEFDS